MKINETYEPEQTVDNKLELLKYTAEVQSKIKDEITSDFILAKLNDKDKEAVIELTGDAYFSKKIIELIERKARKWEWDKETKKWFKRRLTEKESNFIKQQASSVFNAFMIKLQMTTLVNRNVQNNHLIEILAQQQTIEETAEPENVKLKDEIKEQLKNQEK